MITTASIDHRMMNVNTDKIKNAGLEMQMAYRISKTWSADANYSYLHMEHPVITAPENKLYAGMSFSKKEMAIVIRRTIYTRSLYEREGKRERR